MAQDQTSSYKGRWKKWLLLYLVIGAIAYVVIYFVFLHGGGGGSGGSGGGGYFVIPLLLEAGWRLPDGRARRRTGGPASPRRGRV